MPWLLLLIIILPVLFSMLLFFVVPDIPFQAAVHISFYLLLIVSYSKGTKYFEPDNRITRPVPYI